MENGINEKTNQEKETVKTGAIYLPPPVPQTSNWISGGSYNTNNFSALHPVQGYADDCYFIAALSSIAWAALQTLKPKSGIKFTEPVTRAETSYNFEVNYSDIVPVDATGKFIYAKTAKAGNSWPMLYEKAYAMWKTGNNVNQPNIAGIPWGDGIYAMKAITGWRNAGTEIRPNLYEEAGILANIPRATVYLRGTNQVDLTKSGKATFPIVAWSGNIASPPAGIYSNHTYSLLGVYESAPSFIILRNPYGSQVPRFIDPSPQKPAGTWNGINLGANNNGVFPVSIASFRNYFFAFNRVQP